MAARVWDLQNFASGRAFQTPAPARIKVLNPMLTTGPSSDAEIIGFSDDRLKVRVTTLIMVGSMVQIRSGERIAFAKVIATSLTGPDFEIEIDVKQFDR